MIRVVLVDDQTLVRHGIRSLLELAGDITIVAEASDGEDGIAVIGREQPDVVLLDVRMPKKNGLDVLAGVIDADYRGEIHCLLYNAGDETISLPAQSKICQLIIEKIITPTAGWADEISETDRGSGGFGSTG